MLLSKAWKERNLCRLRFVWVWADLRFKGVYLSIKEFFLSSKVVHLGSFGLNDVQPVFCPFRALLSTEGKLFFSLMLLSTHSYNFFLSSFFLPSSFCFLEEDFTLFFRGWRTNKSQKMREMGITLANTMVGII